MKKDKESALERVRDVQHTGQERADLQVRLLGGRPPGPRPGDLYSFPSNSDLAILWSVIRQHPEDAALLLVVPADTNPAAGVADVRVPELAAWGPLTLRCGLGEWFGRESMDDGLRIGFLEDIYVSLAAGLLARLAAGEMPDQGEWRAEMDASPDYTEWMGEIATTSRKIREQSRLGADSARPLRPGRQPRFTVVRQEELPGVPLMAEQVDDVLERTVTVIASMVRGGKTPLQAMKQLASLGVMPEDRARRALLEYERRTGRIRSLREPAALIGRNPTDSWYSGPQSDDKFWPALERHLRTVKRWDDRSIRDLDAASTRMLSFMPPPGQGRFSTRGFGLGHIQAGKTSNYTALIAKAADVGYKLFIVFSGLHNGLRAQTQRRLQRELVSLNQESWHPLTTPTDDFRSHGNVNAFLADATQQKVLCIVKKNTFVLRRLLAWLRGASTEVLGNCPTVVIDDEADQASVNASGAEEQRTVINSLVLQLLQTLPKAAYVGFTATPYANLFIDVSVPEDLYPKDFIVDLPRPAAYFGPERIFGRERLDEDEPEIVGMDVIRQVKDPEVERLKPRGHNDWQEFRPEVTESLAEALQYFWMACACRMARGHLTAASPDTQRHASMLIHTTLYADVHSRFMPEVEHFAARTLRQLRAGDRALLGALAKQWEDERPPGQTAETFARIRPHLEAAIDATKVVVENSRSVIRLEYGDDPTIQIVIGGNTLSRGLTLEGLVVSFFVRTSTAYDTLLQMGRWFGFRPGYEDLPRIWMTEELEGYFNDLATVEQEIRNDIKRYEVEGITPREFAVRVRTHPVLNITSSLKMQSAIDCKVSYAGRRVQTILFKHRDRAWLASNIDAARRLVARIQASGARADVVRFRIWRFRDVAVEEILGFISRYSFHENSQEVRADLIREYIEEQNAHGCLATWNVAIVGRRDAGSSGKLKLGTGIEAPMLQRSRVKRPGADANIGVLMTAQDAIADLDVGPDQLAALGEGEWMKLRDEVPVRDRRGLLLLYPVAKDSVPPPDRVTGNRMPLDAAEHVIGVAFVFPGIPEEMDTPRVYKTADLSRVPREPDELPADEATP